MFSWEAEYLAPPKNISSNSDFCETTTNGSSTWSTLNGQYKKLLFLIQDILSFYLPWSSKQLITLFIWTLSVQFYQKFVFKKLTIFLQCCLIRQSHHTTLNMSRSAGCLIIFCCLALQFQSSWLLPFKIPDFGRWVTPTIGEVWPKPQAQSFSENFFVLRPNGFQFEVRPLQSRFSC